MKFGLGPYLPCTADGGRAAYLDVLTHAVRAEDCAFDSLWVGERHFSQEGACSAAFPLAAAVAVRTEGIRIGVVCELGLAHPVYVAEDAATLDNLSGGRLVLAARWSSDEATWRGYGVTAPQRSGRFRESLAILQRAWAPQPFRFDGAHFRVPARLPENVFTGGQAEVSLTPKPAQLTVPLWVWVDGVDLAALAAEEELDIMLPADASMAQLEATVRAYRGRRASRPADMVALVRHAFVARTDAEARELAGPALRSYYQRFSPADGSSPDTAAAGALDDWGVVGDVDTCIERLRRYRDDLGVNYVVCHMALPGLSPDRVAEAIELFGKAVVSEFRMVNFPREIRTRFLEGGG